MKLHFFVVLTLFWMLVLGRAVRADQVDSRGEYIVNGTQTEAGDLRGTVAILIASEGEALENLSPRTLAMRLRCSGVLISPNVVATAAHCFSDSLYVAAGLRTLDDVWVAEVKAVREVVAHDTEDIALLVLETPVTAVTPMRMLPTDEDLVGEAGISQGYGRRSSPEYEGLLDQGQYESLLNETITPIYDVIGNWILTTEGTNRSGACYGDSGSPLYVERGNEVFIAGFAFGLRSAEEDSECGGGAVYVSAPALIDWIHEKAFGTTPADRGGGGGCSASPNPRAPKAFSLVAMLALLLCVRTRSRALALGVVFCLSALLTGCGSDSAASLCNDRYDPTGDFCDPGVERVDLEAAEERARHLMPSEAWLWNAVGAAEGGVNPDGKAEAWFLRYFIPGQIELPDALFRSVTVFASGDLRPYQELGTVQCVPTEPMILVDSRDLVQDAIRRFEQAAVSVRVGAEGLLQVLQSHRCARAPDEWGGVGFADSFVYYDDDGYYLGMEKAP